MRELYSQSAKMLLCIGQSIAGALLQGDVVLLEGPMGAGKTTLAQGIAKGLGISGPVTSPTFTILRCYEAAVPLYHFDLYRLSDEDEFFAAGLEEFLPGQGIALVEWPQNAPGAMPQKRVTITLSYEGEGRKLVVEGLDNWKDDSFC